MMLVVKKLPANAVDIRDPGWEDPLEDFFTPGESHGQRSLESYVHRVTKSQIGLKQLGTHPHNTKKCTKHDDTAQ